LCSFTVIDYAYTTVARQQRSEKLPYLRILFASIYAYFLFIILAQSLI